MELFKCAYNACIAEMDECVGGLYTFLETTGIADNTLFILTADHGEELGDHNLMDHQLCLYDTLLKVPLIIVNREYFPAGYKIDGQVQLSRLFHTILSVAGVHGYPDVRDRSLCSSISNQGGQRYTFAEYHRPELIKKGYLRVTSKLDHRFETRLFCARGEGYKYIYSEKGEDEFYHLETDPYEEKNLIDQLPEKVNSFRKILKEWRKSLKPQVPSPDKKEEIDIDVDVVSRLKTLGYI